jgi:hypothetical protein
MVSFLHKPFKKEQKKYFNSPNSIKYNTPFSKVKALLVAVEVPMMELLREI